MPRSIGVSLNAKAFIHHSLCLWHSLGTVSLLLLRYLPSFFCIYFECNHITYTYIECWMKGKEEDKNEVERRRRESKCWSLFFEPIFRCTCTISIEHFLGDKKMPNYFIFFPYSLVSSVYCDFFQCNISKFVLTMKFLHLFVAYLFHAM